MPIIDWNEYIFAFTSDLYRYCRKRNFFYFVKCYVINPGFRYSFLMRSAKYLKSKGILFLPIYVITRLLLNHYQFKYGISIPYNTDIGPGLYIGHFGGVVVSSEAKIGYNCNINQEVTIGAAYGGKYPGTPIILNNVYFGPGSKIIGGITIGNNVAIGANCVVTKSVDDYSVVIGVPARVVSMKGSSEYVVNTVEIIKEGIKNQ